MVFQEGKLNTECWKEMTTLIIDFLLSCKNLGIQCAITIQNKTNFWMLWMSCDNCTLFGYLSPGYASFCWPYKVVNWKHGIHYSNSSEERLSQIVGVRYRVYVFRYPELKYLWSSIIWNLSQFPLYCQCLFKGLLEFNPTWN